MLLCTILIVLYNKREIEKTIQFNSSTCSYMYVLVSHLEGRSIVPRKYVHVRATPSKTKKKNRLPFIQSSFIRCPALALLACLLALLFCATLTF